MPTVEYQDETVECEHGDNLKEVLLENNLTPHTGVTKQLNCGGNSTCGTCAVRVTDGPTGVSDGLEQARLSVSTHDDTETVRLSCQYRVTEDIVIEQP